jgi:hypothetical protein
VPSGAAQHLGGNQEAMNDTHLLALLSNLGG